MKNLVCSIFSICAVLIIQNSFSQVRYNVDYELDVYFKDIYPGADRVINAGDVVLVTIEVMFSGPGYDIMEERNFFGEDGRCWSNLELPIASVKFFVSRGFSIREGEDYGSSMGGWADRPDRQNAKRINSSTIEFPLDYACCGYTTEYGDTSGLYSFYLDVIDPSDAYLTAELVSFHKPDQFSDALFVDMDSTPNNGVDTNGDGNFNNDMSDEDDGDGVNISELCYTRKPLRSTGCGYYIPDWPDYEIYRVATYRPYLCLNSEALEVANVDSNSSEINNSSSSGVPSSSPIGPGSLGSPAGGVPGGSGSLRAEAGCMIAADVPSTIAANPEGTEGVFVFDYYIESVARIEYVDTNTGAVTNKNYNMNYYVNSNDGSMLFSTEEEGFFDANAFPTADNMGEIHEVVWKSDGQIVIYALESITGTLRAVIMAQDQTAADVALQKRLNVTEFMNSMGSMTRSPDPLPPHLQAKWGEVPGYTGQMNDVDGTKSTVTIYMGRSPDLAPIPTSSPLVGFQTGIFKDNVQDNCNKLVVYSKMTAGASSDFMEVELKDIRRVRKEFDGTPYQRTQLGAVPGSVPSTQMQAYNAQYEALSLQEEAAERARRNCGPNDTACYDLYTRQIEQLKQQQEDLECEFACRMGMAELYDNCSCQ